MTLQAPPSLVSFISVQSGASITSNVHMVLNRICIAPRFGSDAGCLDKLFELYTKMPTQVAV